MAWASHPEEPAIPTLGISPPEATPPVTVCNSRFGIFIDWDLYSRMGVTCHHPGSEKGWWGLPGPLDPRVAS